MVSVPGIGEAPMLHLLRPAEDTTLELLVRKTGSLTQVLHGKGVGDRLGIRGPFGSGFRIEEFYGKDILFVCGGLGLAPLRSLITPVVENRERFGEVTILSGAVTPNLELYREDLKAWARRVRVIRWWSGPRACPTTATSSAGHRPDPGPRARPRPDPRGALRAAGHVQVRGHRAGPPPDPPRADLHRPRAPHEVRRGEVRSLQINKVYCCCDGPVFKLSQVRDLPEALA